MIHGFVLAGGLGSRMGADKARVPDPEGWPLATRVAGVLRGVGAEVALVRRTADGLPWIWPHGGEIPVIYEPTASERHPLWGVAAGLDIAGAPSLFLPCDLPFFPPEGLHELLAIAPPVVARSGGFVHPLVGIYPAEWADRARALARAGAPARLLAEGAKVVDMDEAWMMDVNRPLWPDPLVRLAARLVFLGPAGVARAVEGERRRLLARGAVPISAGASSPPG